MVFKACRRYASFITDSERSKTLEDYLALLLRCIRMDVVLAIIYVALGLVPLIGKHEPVLSTPSGIASVVLLALIVVLWLVDAGLLLHFKRVIEGSVDKPDAVPELIRWKRICVASSTLSLFVYLVRFVAEAWMSVGQGNAMWISLAVGVLIFVVKLMRVLAVHSFSAWLRLRWPTQSAGQPNP